MKHFDVIAAGSQCEYLCGEITSENEDEDIAQEEAAVRAQELYGHLGDTLRVELKEEAE